MAEKWVVTVYGDDGGVYPKVKKNVETAVKYLNEQSGGKFQVAEIENQVSKKGSCTIIDDWGRKLVISLQEVGTCRVCKKTNMPLTTMLCSIYTSEGANTQKSELVEVCPECYDYYECGYWNLVQQKNRVVIKKKYLGF